MKRKTKRKRKVTPWKSVADVSAASKILTGIIARTSYEQHGQTTGDRRLL
jgi:hypothetical protein